jgi:hypothetical protein
MATKKKTKRAAKKTLAKAVKKSPKKSATKKSAVKKAALGKSGAPKKRVIARQAAKPNAKPAAKPIAKPPAKSFTAKAPAKNRKPVSTRAKQQITESVDFQPAGLGARSGGQSGDLQGLSNRAGADSESVDELLEEGNAFEAEVVKGVEDVPDADEGEIVTHEVPEDDVPGEYNEQ